MKFLQHINGALGKSGGYFFDQAMVSGGNFVLALILARELGPEDFGVFSLGWMIVLFVNSLQQAFILTPMFSLAARQDNGYLGNLAKMQLLLLLMLLILVSVGLVLTSIWEAPPLFLQLLLPVAGLSAGHQLYDFSRKTLLLQKHLKQVQWLDGTVVLLQLGSLGGLMASGLLSPRSAFFALTFAYGAPALWPFFATLQKGNEASFRNLLITHWRYGKWLGATALLQWFSGNFFLIAGAAILGTTALGAIRMAQTFMGLLNVFLLALENFIPARAASVFLQGGVGSLRHYLRSIGIRSAVLFFPALLGIALGAELLIEWVFGPAYLPYVSVLQGFALLYCAVYLGTLLRYYYRTTGATREIFYAYGFSTLAGFFLAQPFVSSWGLEGIVAGMLLCQLIICGWLLCRIPFSTVKILS